MEEPPVELATNEARAGSTPYIVRYVPAVSLVPTVIVLIGLGLARQF